MLLIDNILVSDEIIKEKFVCNLGKCKGACCWKGDFGAPLETEEIDIIEEILPFILSYLPEKNQKKIRAKGAIRYYKEKDFNGTALMPNGACVFMNTDSMGQAKCAFEQAHSDEKIKFTKPISCHLYPIRVSKNTTTNFEALNYDQWDICSDACSLGESLKVPVFRFVRDALIRKYGSEFYEALEAATSDHLTD